jgi:hypothetical protein
MATQVPRAIRKRFEGNGWRIRPKVVMLLIKNHSHSYCQMESSCCVRERAGALL